MNKLRHRAWLFLAASITLQILVHRSQTWQSHDGLQRRSLDVKTLTLPYNDWYFSASPTAKPFIAFAIVLILGFLFSFIGICASDFFCPNLATIASVLGLSESTAGVTFLAFGNGSPDVFSTFAALNGGTLGLAVGELLGAATFIVSVVVGSIALIRPFHVPRFAFLRDTIFFTAAVLVLVVVLKDGHLSIVESGGMVMLYLAYVAVVIGSTYWHHKEESETSTIRPSPESSASASPTVRPTLSQRPSLYRLNTEEDEFARRANFSLLSAIEFRDVVNSLRTPGGRSPVSGHEREDYFGAVLGHRRSISSPHEWPQYSPAAALGASVNIASSLTPTVVVKDNRRRSASLLPHSRHHPADVQPKPSLHLEIPSVPTIALIDPSGQSASPTQPSTPNESRFRIRHHTRAIFWTLFPSLREFRHKSIIGMVMALVSVPAILALTLTLPVVDDASGDGGIQLPIGAEEPLDEERGRVTPDIGEELHHMVENGFHPLHSPHPQGGEAPHDEGGIGCFSKELTAAQAFFGPVICAALIFSESALDFAQSDDLESFPWIMLGVGAGGIVGAVAVMMIATDGSSGTWRIARCFGGFICSMVWIAAIANEVVGVLLAVGEILGLSEAIIGLTIFAVGNSLADLVANVTVAQFAPTMAYAACFGGPMLNLLLGIGGSGTYGILISHQTVTLAFSPTLWVSAAGLVIMLVATMIFVPLNGYLIDRRWACCLIAGYVVLMCANIGVEMKTGRS